MLIFKSLRNLLLFGELGTQLPLLCSEEVPSTDTFAAPKAHGREVKASQREASWFLVAQAGKVQCQVGPDGERGAGRQLSQMLQSDTDEAPTAAQIRFTEDGLCPAHRYFKF